MKSGRWSARSSAVPSSPWSRQSNGEQKSCFFCPGCPGWGANPGPLDFIYFLIFSILPLSHSGSPTVSQNLCFFGQKN
jgi:hypothetical protein